MNNLERGHRARFFARFPRAQPADIAVQRVCGIDDLIQPAKGSQNLRDIAEAHPRVAGFDLAQGVPGDACALGHLWAVRPRTMRQPFTCSPSSASCRSM